MEAEEKDIKKRRRRSIRNLRRQSGIVPFDIDFQSEESQREKKEVDNVKPGNTGLVFFRVLNYNVTN